MDTISLKKYIYDNKKVEFILDKIGCHSIKYHIYNEYWSCANYDGDNVSAINVKNNPYLNVTNWTRYNKFNDNADLITLVEYNKQYDFREAIKYIHEILGLDFKFTKKKTPEVKNENPLAIFEKHKCNRYVDVAELKVLDEDVLNDYIQIPYIGWLREGVMAWTVKKFGIAYSYSKKRVIIPMRYWLTGELVGINSRTTIENYKELGIKKFYITPSYKKGLNIFGLYENYNHILNAGYVVVYESEKSVLKRHSMNDKTGVALSGHSITDEQVRILIGLNVDIVISMDKDVSIEEVRYMCEKFYNIRKVYYTIDIYGLLDDKDSIVDKGNKVYEYLFKYKIPYGIKEHKEYLKSLNDKGSN